MIRCHIAIPASNRDSLLPFISVVIPTRNRAQELLRCVRSLSALDYPPDRCQIVIVNDGGELPAANLLSSRSASLPVTILTQPHAGPATARNYGARHARGDLLAFTDDDCIVSPDWLRILAQCFDSFPESGIVGQTLNRVDGDPYAAASEAVLDYFAKLEWEPWGLSRILTTENLALPAERFHSIGGFDETFLLAGGEDRDLCDRWLRRGWELQYAEDARVFRAPIPGLLPFLCRHFRYGRGAYQFSQLRSRRGGGRLSVRRVSVYRDLINRGAAYSRSTRAKMTMLIAASQLMTACGFAWEGARSRRAIAALDQVLRSPSGDGANDV